MKKEVSIFIDDVAKWFDSTEDATAFLMNYNEPEPNQIGFVESELLSKKRITRNFALPRFITRLSSIIHTLKKRGYEIEGAVGEGGVDYVYTLKKKPKKKKA